MNTEEVKKMFKLLSGIYDNVYWTEEKAKTWALVLADVPLEKAKKAIVIIARKDTIPPTPARLLQVIREEEKSETDSAEPASIIWERLIGLAAKGDYGEQIFNQTESERTKQAVRAVGGFQRIRMAELDEIPFIRKDFIKYYSDINVYEDTKQISDEVNKLIGCISESKKIEEGVKPVLIEGRVRW